MLLSYDIKLFNIMARNMLNHNNLHHPDPFLQFVQKNKKLPMIREHIENTEDGKRLLENLHHALENKNPEDAIFTHEYLLMLVQILFEQKRITENDRMTLFFYITVLRVHTTKQALREQDSDTKILCQVEMILPHHENYNQYADLYWEGVCPQLTRINNGIHSAPVINQLQIEDIKNTMKTASRFEGGFIVIHPPADKNHFAYQILLELSKARPLFFCFAEKEQMMILPTTQMIKMLLENINPVINFSLAPILGQLKPKTLFDKFHIHQMHTVSVYSEHITSNLKNVHDKRGGALYAMLHDYVHIFVFSLIFNKKMYDFFTKELVPFFIRLSDFVDRHLDCFQDANEIQKKMGQFIEGVNDYFIIDLSIYKDIFEKIYTQENSYFYTNKLDMQKIKLIFTLAFSSIDKDVLEDYNVSPFSIPEVLMKRLALLKLDFPQKLSYWKDEDFDKCLELYDHAIKLTTTVTHMMHYYNIKTDVAGTETIQKREREELMNNESVDPRLHKKKKVTI